MNYSFARRALCFLSACAALGLARVSEIARFVFGYSSKAEEFPDHGHGPLCGGASR